MNSIKFTPELFGEFPRRSAAIPNADGSFAIYTVSTYSFEATAETKETKIINLKTNEHFLFSDDPNVTSAQWLVGNQIMWQESKDGKTKLFAGTVGSASKGTYLLGSIDAPIDGVKTKVLNGDSIALACSAPAKPDGTIFNPENEPKPKTSAREFGTIMTRYWDNWTKPYNESIFYMTLHKHVGKGFRLGEQPPINALMGSTLRFPHRHSPMGDGGSFDLSSEGIIFTTVDRKEDLAKSQTAALYFIPIKSFQDAKLSEPVRIDTPDVKGSADLPAFSVDGKKFAFFKTKKHELDGWGPGYIFIADTKTPKIVTKVVLDDPEEKGKEWDRSPAHLLWSSDGQTIFFLAPDSGRGRIFKADIAEATAGKATIHSTPLSLTDDGTVNAAYRISDASESSDLLFSATSMIDSSLIGNVETKTGKITILSSLTEDGALLGISKGQMSDFYLDSKDKSYRFHNFMVTPPAFDPKKKYPLAIFIHGGPQAAWMDSWSHRWCPALYAAQGYVVLVPNFTGSNSYGEEFGSAVIGNWGGRPYEDIVQCFEHAKTNLSFVDTNRAIAMGGSYGGYMINWIAGQPLAKEFKALVCHNGIWNFPSMFYSSDVSHGHIAEFGVAYWDAREYWKRYDPSEFCENWSTPMLFIHSDQDFRCPLEQGMAPFNVCQVRGIPSRLLNFPDENHFVLKRENQLHWYKTIIGWINKWTETEGDVELAPPASEPVQTHVESV